MRPLTHGDRGTYAHMLHRAFNTWYAAHGDPADYFRCTPATCSAPALHAPNKPHWPCCCRRPNASAARPPLFVIPMDKRELLETLYAWGARNVETHLCQVRGQLQAFKGVNLPSFLPETG